MKRILFLLFIPFSLAVSGQKKRQKNAAAPQAAGKDTLRTSMHLIAQNYGDSIVVRWAPGDATAWLLLKNSGYVFQRMVFSRNEKNEYKLLDSSTRIIRPWKLEDWAAYFKASSDTFAAVDAQISYGKTLNLDDGKDGASLNNLFDKYDEQQNRYAFALLLADFDPPVAKGLGFRFVEKGVHRELYYLFTVFPVEGRAKIISDTGRVLVRGSEIYKKDTATRVSAVPGDRVINLFWIRNPLARTSYSGYFIEKSEDGKNFKKLNRLPFVPSSKSKEGKPVHFTDSVAANYKKYYYRVSGINAFGDVSYPSAALATMAVDLSGPKAPEVTEIKNAGRSGKIYLKWDKKEKEPDFKGYVVGRSNNLEGPYDAVSKDYLSFSVHEFTDDYPVEGLPNFYVVAEVDTAGNVARSMPVYMNVDDYSPPAQPTGLTGNIDSSGRVTVRWNWGKENDLAGYKLFFANAPDQKFTPLTGELYPDTLYTDSIVLKTLTKKIYYRVIAYDRSMNPSPASEILVLNKPDVVPPMQAIIHDFLVTDSGVLIKWFPGSSSDAARQRLFRKKPDESGWQLLAELPVKDSVYADRTTAPLLDYEYAIETIDSSGLNSGKSFSLKVHTYAPDYQGKIKRFDLAYVPGKQHVLLEWTAPGKGINYYILYRERENEGLKMAANISGNALNYEDQATTGNFRYAIKAIYANGNESALSEVKPIRVP